MRMATLNNLRSRRLWIFILMTGWIISGLAKERFDVGIYESPPFVIRDEGGNWSGITVELWDHLSDVLDIDFAYKEYDLEGLLDALDKNKIDLAVSSLVITKDRMELMDFSHSYFSAGLGIAAKPRHKDAWRGALDHIFTPHFVKGMLSLLLVLFLFGCLVYVFERRKNPDHFGGTASRGIGEAFWWSAVTMTTVGYGDRTPVTLGGRLVTLVLMFASIIVISSFTGALSSALTINQMAPAVNGFEDLPGFKVGALARSSAAEFLHEEGISYQAFTNTVLGLQAVEQGSIDCFVDDRPVLDFYIRRDFGNSLQTVGNPFHLQFYALPFPRNSSHIREVDLAMLDFTESPTWYNILRRYIGRH